MGGSSLVLFSGFFSVGPSLTSSPLQYLGLDVLIEHLMAGLAKCQSHIGPLTDRSHLSFVYAVAIELTNQTMMSQYLSLLFIQPFLCSFAFPVLRRLSLCVCACMRAEHFHQVRCLSVPYETVVEFCPRMAHQAMNTSLSKDTRKSDQEEKVHAMQLYHLNPSIVQTSISG